MAKKQKNIKVASPMYNDGGTVIIQQPRKFNVDISNYMTAIRSAENVDNTRRSLLYDLYGDILMDPHLSSIIDKRKKALSNKQIQFQRDGKPDDIINEQLESPWFHKFLEDAWDSLAFGFTALQFHHDGQWLNYDLIPRKHVEPVKRHILKQQGDTNGYPFEDFNHILFIGSDRDLGLLAKAIPWVIYKRNSVADWAQFAEIFGMPIREYVYDSNDDDARAQLLRDASAQGASGIYIHPEGSKLNFIESSSKTGSCDIYDGLTRRCNSELSKLILGNTLTTEESTKGTQALGNVHKQEEDSITHSDLQLILNILNYEMTDIFQAFGFNTSGGRFVYVPAETEDLSSKITVIEKLKLWGLPIDDDYLYETFHIEKPKNYNKLKEPAKTKETAIKKKETIVNRLFNFFEEPLNKEGNLGW
ncbi:MAG: phage portal protein family protein [Marinifilaceae bacterium]